MQNKKQKTAGEQNQVGNMLLWLSMTITWLV